MLSLFCGRTNLIQKAPCILQAAFYHRFHPKPARKNGFVMIYKNKGSGIRNNWTTRREYNGTGFSIKRTTQLFKNRTGGRFGRRGRRVGVLRSRCFSKAGSCKFIRFVSFIVFAGYEHIQNISPAFEFWRGRILVYHSKGVCFCHFEFYRRQSTRTTATTHPCGLVLICRGLGWFGELESSLFHHTFLPDSHSKPFNQTIQTSTDRFVSDLLSGLQRVSLTRRHQANAAEATVKENPIRFFDLSHNSLRHCRDFSTVCG